MAIKSGGKVNVNDYAVFMAIKAIQRVVKTLDDGLFGKDTAAAVTAYQKANGLKADGIVGPDTAKHMFGGMLNRITPSTASVNSALTHKAARGHVSLESQFDPGAVGVSTPDDLGLGQINGPSHPDLSIDDRLTPTTALPWIVNFVESNMSYMGVKSSTPEPPMPSSAAATAAVNLNQYTDAIAAYNLGKGGATLWRNAGRKQFYGQTDVWKYIYVVRKAAI
jgi:peptidoglycan hydrolase-like protein with peptidoglycan-binding domain